MRYTIVIGLFSLLFLGCTKDKFSSVPKITYLSANTTTVAKNSLLEMRLEFTDAEGDIEDTIFIEKVVPKDCISGSLILDDYLIPSFPREKNSKGELIITFTNGTVTNYPSNLNVGPKCTTNDSCFFRFSIRDKAKNTSDTIVSEQIVFLAN
jgi:hypothetical protein